MVDFKKKCFVVSVLLLFISFPFSAYSEYYSTAQVTTTFQGPIDLDCERSLT